MSRRLRAAQWQADKKSPDRSRGRTKAHTKAKLRASDTASDRLNRTAELAHLATWGGRPHDGDAVEAAKANLENRDVKFCLKNAARLNRWENSFVQSLGHQNFPLTAKQQNVITDIIGKILSKRRRR